MSDSWLVQLRENQFGAHARRGGLIVITIHNWLDDTTMAGITETHA